MSVKEIFRCRSCDAESLTPIISFGNQYISNFVESKESQEKNGVRVPLDLVLCENCKLLQLKHNAPGEAMWGEQYWYKSGISSTIKADLKDITEKAQKLSQVKNQDIIIDIGCNDGTLLDFYPKENFLLVGFEPSKNVAREAELKGHNVIGDFFNAEGFIKNFGIKKAKIITAISMFYDLENPNRFVEDIKQCLDVNGLFIIQQNYLLKMLEQNAFDNILHEHREYYSLISLKNLLDKHGLEIFDIEQNDINGGSIRTYIKFKGNNFLNGFSGAEERIANLIEKERGIGLEIGKPYLEFASRIDGIKERLMGFLREEKAKGKRIWIYGASTRGNVALQYFGINTELIDGIADMNSDKWGKKTIGSLITIDSPVKMREAHPDYLLVNTWHFLDEIVKQEKDYFDSGGRFVVALPEFKVISKD